MYNTYCNTHLSSSKLYFSQFFSPNKQSIGSKRDVGDLKTSPLRHHSSPPIRIHSKNRERASLDACSGIRDGPRSFLWAVWQCGDRLLVGGGFLHSGLPSSQLLIHFPVPASNERERRSRIEKTRIEKQEMREIAVQKSLYETKKEARVKRKLWG